MRWQRPRRRRRRRRPRRSGRRRRCVRGGALLQVDLAPLRRARCRRLAARFPDARPLPAALAAAPQEEKEATARLRGWRKLELDALELYAHMLKSVGAPARPPKGGKGKGKGKAQQQQQDEQPPPAKRARRGAAGGSGSGRSAEPEPAPEAAAAAAAAAEALAGPSTAKPDKEAVQAQV